MFNYVTGVCEELLDGKKKGEVQYVDRTISSNQQKIMDI